MNLWLYSLRDMARRPGRSLLTLLSIVLGVATVFAVTTTTGAARLAFDRMSETLSGKADAKVVAKGGGRFAQELLAELEKSKDIKVGVPLLFQIALINNGNERIQINGVGTRLDKEKILRPFHVVTGRLVESEGELVLEESLAKSIGIKADDEVKVLTRRGVERLKVVGLIRPTEIWAFTQGGLAYFDLEDWQHLSKAADKIDEYQIMLVPGDKDKMLDALARTLPPELQLRSSRDPHSTSNVTLMAFEYGLDVTRSLALVVAALLILNTFMMNVAERRGQISVLRLIGSTRGQIMALLLREGALVGLVGALFGLPLGWGLAHWLAEGMENAFGVSLQNPEFAVGPALFAFAMGPVVALLAAYLPARRAAQIGPLEGLRQRSSGQPEQRGWKRIGLGLFLLVASLVGMGLSYLRVLPQAWAITVAIFFLFGMLLGFPLVLGWAGAVVYRLLRFLGPMEFELAYRQMVRTEGRANLTWGILFMAVATSVGTGLILTDVIDDIRTDVRKTTLADFVLRVTHTNLATGTSASLPEDIPPLVKKMNGVDSMELLTIASMENPEVGRVVAVIREFALYERLPMDIRKGGNPATVREQVLQGDIVVSEILAGRLKKTVDDAIVLEHEGKRKTFRIAGTTPFFLAGGMAFFMERKVAESAFGPMGSEALLINAQPDQRDDVGERLRTFAQDQGLLFQTYAEVQARLQGILNTVVASLWVLLALGFLIAVFGVTNTLMMNILEQTREIGLMRVLGMTRRQIRKMILAQSAYVGILAIIPGLASGVLLAYIVRSSTLSILGESPQFGVLLPWLVPYAGVLLVLVLLFGWLPAARAARLNILESIRTE